jgi:hypothetical protein
MPDISKTVQAPHQPGGFSRRGVLIAGFTSLLAAVALFFAWQDRILSHLHHETANTEILKIGLHEPYSALGVSPAPATKSMQGGVILRLDD